MLISRPNQMLVLRGQILGHMYIFVAPNQPASTPHGSQERIAKLCLSLLLNKMPRGSSPSGLVFLYLVMCWTVGVLIGMVILGPAEAFELKSGRLSYTISSLRIMTRNILVLMALWRTGMVCRTCLLVLGNQDSVETKIYQNLLATRQPHSARPYLLSCCELFLFTHMYHSKVIVPRLFSILILCVRFALKCFLWCR